MASKVNLIIDQGSTFSTTIELKDSSDNDLVVSEYSSRGQLRKHYASSNSVAFSITLTDGLMVMSLTANQTSSLAPGRYVYDVELIDPANSVIRLIEGILTVTPEVTK